MKSVTSILKNVLFLVFPMLALGCATSPSDQSYDSPIGKWSEKWESPGGQMMSSKVEISSETSGQYLDFYNSQVEFYAVEEPRIWKAYWINPDHGRYPCAEEKGGSKYWGEITYRFNETYTRYQGSYNTCGEGQKFSINGIRS